MKNVLNVIFLLNLLVAFNNGYCQNEKEGIIFDSIISFDFPKVDYNITDFEIIRGFPLVPIYNGLYAAGFDTWLKDPEGDFILSLCKSINDNSIFYLTTNDSITSIRKRYPKSDNIPEKEIVNFKNGFYKIRSFGIDSLLLWGIQFDSFFTINYIFNGSIINLYSSKNQINDVYVVQSHLILIATNYEVLLFTDFSNPLQIIKIEHIIESVAVSDDGTLYIATDFGIFKKGKKNENIVLIAKGLRGILKTFQDKLFVLEPQNSRVLLLKNP